MGSSNRIPRFSEVCLTGDIEKIKEMSKAEQDWNYAIYFACWGGHMEIIEFMISKGANDWNRGMEGACKGGHMEIVKLMILKGADNWNLGMQAACSGGHMEIFKLMISKGANDWNWGLFCAFYGSIVKYFILAEPTDLNTEGYGEYCVRHLELMDFIISKGANNFECLKYSKVPRHYKLCKKCDFFDKEKYKQLVIDQCPVYQLLKGSVLHTDLLRILKTF